MLSLSLCLQGWCVPAADKVGCEGVCKVKGKDKLWESSGRMKGLMELCCGLPGSVRHRARMCGRNTGFGWGVWGEEQGTSRCYRVFSAAGSVLASAQTAVSQTGLWLCFLRVKAVKHCLWHDLHKNQGNANWSLGYRAVRGCRRAVCCLSPSENAITGTE